jgi:hypothetical protein
MPCLLLDGALAAAVAEGSAGAGAVEDAAVCRDLEAERRWLRVEERDSLDAGDRCADEGAILGLVYGELALGLHRACGRRGGLRLLDERALARARRLRSARAELGREQDAGEHEADDERDDSEAAAAHRLVIGGRDGVLERAIRFD